MKTQSHRVLELLINLFNDGLGLLKPVLHLISVHLATAHHRLHLSNASISQHFRPKKPRQSHLGKQARKFILKLQNMAEALLHNGGEGEQAQRVPRWRRIEHDRLKLKTLHKSKKEDKRRTTSWCSRQSAHFIISAKAMASSIPGRELASSLTNPN